ncbi:LPXTG-site transpeptidase (sortase) family protein [Friedmanniella luteola]|uniref:LPXTG-site transpeptidase (Sortase) family protein n=1 Tax=Friedmanniella luteola TaxID=546871 RepID=A0A1H1W1I2_9ACTN|nr:class F sortase [Friedmanniella luteola]SDS91138.1 LPXTG-site transpeptidase (sortase) family protein [Friedmanniella luteola]
MTPHASPRHRTAVLGSLGLLLLLPLGGCAGGTAAPATAPPARTTAAPTPTPTPAAPSREPSEAAAPAVPTVRATLRPAAREAPAPVRLVADDVRIDLPVQPYGVDADGFMLLPATVDEVAWYAYSARPGARAGTTVLAAHVDTVADGLGPFANLRDLDEGDELRVTAADEQVHRYAVSSVEKVAKAEVPLDRVFRRDGDPALVVITCGGSFDRGRGYSDNVVVTARPLG